jgi:hypothetical protein
MPLETGAFFCGDARGGLFFFDGDAEEAIGDLHPAGVPAPEIGMTNRGEIYCRALEIYLISDGKAGNGET